MSQEILLNFINKSSLLIKWLLINTILVKNKNKIVKNKDKIV